MAENDKEIILPICVPLTKSERESVKRIADHDIRSEGQTIRIMVQKGIRERMREMEGKNE